MPGTVDEETGGSTNQAQTRLCKHRLLAKFLSKVQVKNQKAKHPACALGPEALRQIGGKNLDGCTFVEASLAGGAKVSTS